jgi:exopolysaccharide biosynthesis polyprenyl glycosylphosphotransferase
MLRKHFRLLSSAHHLLDLVLVAIAIWLAHVWTPFFSGWLMRPSWIELEQGHTTLFFQIGLAELCWVFFSRKKHLYQSHRTEVRFSILLRVGETTIQSLGVAVLAALLITGSLAFHPVLAIVLTFVVISGSRLLLLEALFRARSHGFNFRRVLFVGRGAGAFRFMEELERHSHYGLKVIGALSFRDETVKSDDELISAGGVTRSQVEDMGLVDSFHEVVAQEDVDQVLIFPSGETRDCEVAELCRDCDAVGIDFLYTPGYVAENRVSAMPVWYGSVPGLAFRPENNPTCRLAVKRAFDIAVSSLSLLLLSPFVLIISILIKLTDGGPVLFKQVRVGKGGRRFDCYKFRSMNSDAEDTKQLLLSRNEADGPVFKIKQDPRITAVGRFLRKYSLDEMPQIWNVLRGDMSLVGPRPPVPDEVRNYEWWQRRRLSVKPGLTCIWQVWGRNQVTFKRWVEMDIQYIDGWSLWLDLKLIAHTFGVVVRGTGM